MGLIRKIFRKILLSYPSFWERYGIEVVPDHFYYPVPSIGEFEPDFFERESECVGVHWNARQQENHLRNVFVHYIHELEPRLEQRMISSIDSAIYYAMIRHYRPKKIIEIGGGESTRIAARACLKNAECDPCELVCIDPNYDADFEKGFEGPLRLIKARVQGVSLSEFEDCEMIFIDSSLVVRIGSDVVWEMMEIVPRVKKGCLIHWHDIFVPKEYPEAWVRHRLFWTEQYLVMAFLMYNTDFEILWASHFVDREKGEEIKEIFQEHALHDYPISSPWVRRVS